MLGWEGGRAKYKEPRLTYSKKEGKRKETKRISRGEEENGRRASSRFRVRERRNREEDRKGKTA